MSDLPPPPKKKTQPGPSMLDRNREVEQQEAQAAALRLPSTPAGPTGKLSIAPMSQDTLDGFEDWYLTLKRQRRTLKRYHVMQAIMEAVLESPTVQAEVISRLK